MSESQENQQDGNIRVPAPRSWSLGSAGFPLLEFRAPISNAGTAAALTGLSSMATAAPEEGPAPEPEPEPERRPEPKTPAIRHSLSVTLGELFSGSTRRLALSRRVQCQECSGSGTREGREAVVCGDCHGEGRISDENGFGLPIGMMRGLGQQPCQTCSGTGQLMEGRDKCRRCRGAKQVLERKIVTVEVTSGSSNRDRIVLPEESDQPVDGVGKPGDLVVTLCQRPHSCYSRRGDDLLLELPISLRTALCGGTCSIQTLDGEHLQFNCPPGLRPGDIRSIARKGFPVKRSTEHGTQHAPQTARGRLLVRFAVTFPDSISSAAAQKLRAALPAGDATGAADASKPEDAPGHEDGNEDRLPLRSFAMVTRYGAQRREPLLAEMYGGIEIGVESADALERSTVSELKAFLGKYGYVTLERGLEKANLVAMAQRLFVAKAAEQAERRSAGARADGNASATGAGCEEGHAEKESRVEEIPLSADDMVAAKASRESGRSEPPVAVKLVDVNDTDRTIAEPEGKQNASNGRNAAYEKGPGGFAAYGADGGFEDDDFSDGESDGGQQCSQQ
jgi:DnaJ-class molecular chaperone